MKCSNCEKEVIYSTALLVRMKYDSEPIVTLCNDCTNDVLTLKIVLSRKDTKTPFAFQGYLPVACVK